jgi:hypothetical protein
MGKKSKPWFVDYGKPDRSPSIFAVTNRYKGIKYSQNSLAGFGRNLE